MIFKDPDIEKALDKIHYPLMILKTLPIYIYIHTHTHLWLITDDLCYCTAETNTML